jgi:hypothetical protein
MTALAVGPPNSMVSNLDLDVLACQFKPSRKPREGWHGSGPLMTDDEDNEVFDGSDRAIEVIQAL